MRNSVSALDVICFAAPCNVSSIVFFSFFWKSIFSFGDRIIFRRDFCRLFIIQQEKIFSTGILVIGVVFLNKCNKDRRKL